MIPQDILDAYAAHLQAKYDQWNEGTSGAKNPFPVRFDVGKKFIKVTAENSRSVHSFIVNVDGYIFPKGSILKPANAKVPAANAARGNVLTRDWESVDWTGPAYLR